MTGTREPMDSSWSTMTTTGAVTIIAVAFLAFMTFYAVVVTTQRHYMRMKQLDKELAEIQMQEKAVNGRTADDLIGEAKAAERMARAREKEAKALDRIAERRAEDRALEAGE